MSVGEAGPYLITDSTPGRRRHQPRRAGRRPAARSARAGRPPRSSPPAPGARRSPRSEVRDEGVEGAYVAVFADSLSDVQDNVAADPPPGADLGRDRARDRRARRLPRGARAGGPRQAPRARRAQGRGGRLLAADPGRLRRRARAAGRRLRRHAGAARAARPGAQAVHRHRLARAAHADLLARRLPRAAGRRGPRRGDPARVPRADPRPGGPHAQPRGRAARPLAPGGRRARAAAGADRRRPARARRRGGVHAGGRAAPSPTSRSTCGAEPIELDCDPERVAQVLRILLDNALRHTPPGTAVRVSAARANGHVRVEVSDVGLGIKRQNMPHIFEPFFTSNEQAQGAGLGLAIARELAERMHGRLTRALGAGPDHVLAGAAVVRRAGHAARRGARARARRLRLRRRRQAILRADDDHARRGRAGHRLRAAASTPGGSTRPRRRAW